MRKKSMKLMSLRIIGQRLKGENLIFYYINKLELVIELPR